MTRWLFPSVIVVAAVAALAAAYRGVHGFSLDPKIKPYEVLNLTVTILIAFFLQYYLAGRARDSRSERDILIGAVKEAIQLLRLCRETVSACHYEKPIPDDKKREIISLFRRLSNELLNVETIMNISGCSDLTENCRLLQVDLRTYKIAATGGTFPSSYTKTAIASQDRAYRELHRNLHSLVFDINKHV